MTGRVLATMAGDNRPKSPLARRPAPRTPGPARPGRPPASARDADWWEWFEQGRPAKARERREAARQRQREVERQAPQLPESEPGIIRKFRSNFASYVSVNGGLLLLNVYTGLADPWFLFPAVFWGIGLASQYGKLWSAGYSMRDVLNRPPAPDALPPPGVAGNAPVAHLPEPTTGDFGKLAGHMAQMRKDHSAIVRLVDRLPESERQMLPDVVPTVNALYERATELARMMQQMEGNVDDGALDSLDARLAALEAGGAGPEEGRRLDLLKRQRESLVELMGRRSQVESQFESCVLAVQNVRFDLLRLRSAGVQEVLSDLTSATQAARAMQIDVEAAIDAAGEIREALGRGRSKS